MLKQSLFACLSISVLICVVSVPLPRAEAVLAAARGIEEKEEAILADIRAGADLAEARRRHGYHSLQTRPS